jgi:predicted nucleotide-binding protein (sugar kinase/HSP70/actin superfamily)
MQSKNSFAMSLFKKGFRQMFFGPKGIVTRKSAELRSYHKSFESKFDLNTKIFAGSLDYYDYLSGYNSFFERLKNSRKKMLKINGNFTITNNMQEKMHAAYLEYEKKREKYKKKKKLLLIKKTKK